MNEQYYFLDKLKEDLSKKQQANESYSLRAYAKSLGVHPATLCQVLSGKRSLPLKDSDKVIKKLDLSPKERTLFLESLYRSKSKLDDIKIDGNEQRFMLDEAYYKIISEWEHYAVLELYDVKNFIITVQSVSKKLNINEMRAEIVIKNLLNAGLLIQENGVLKKAHKKIRTTEDISSSALKNSHLETLELGSKKLKEIEVSLRDFSSMTIAIDPVKLTEAKTIIREFRQKMMELLRSGEKQDVYQLAIQFFPLSEIDYKN